MSSNIPAKSERLLEDRQLLNLIRRVTQVGKTQVGELEKIFKRIGVYERHVERLTRQLEAETDGSKHDKIAANLIFQIMLLEREEEKIPSLLKELGIDDASLLQATKAYEGRLKSNQHQAKPGERLDTRASILFYSEFCSI